jgi:hypothetical protein
MAIFITPSTDFDELFETKYAQEGDTLQVIEVDGELAIGFPSAQPDPAIYACRPLVNTRGVEDLSGAWAGCDLITEFPLLDFTSCVNFSGAWQGCTSLTTFPAHAFDNCGASNYADAWVDCALSQQSVDNILVSINTAGQSNGRIDIAGGTSSPLGPTGLAAKLSLVSRGWTVTTN